ncbi:hypothetical protein [Pollutimonas subterranea]|nr:hypothetical protein [Pollutimonas subterranea]
MKSILIAIIISALSGCGTYSQGYSDNNAGYQDQLPSTGNGN